MKRAFSAVVKTSAIQILVTLLTLTALTSPKSKPKLVLEVTESAGGMVPQLDDHLYLRLFDDGFAQWQEDPPVSADFRQLWVGSTFSGHVRVASVEHAAWLLREPGVRNLAGPYGPFIRQVDSSHWLKFKFLIGKFERTVVVINPGEQLGPEVPDGLKAIYCETARLRKEAESGNVRSLFWIRLMRSCDDDPAGRR